MCLGFKSHCVKRVTLCEGHDALSVMGCNGSWCVRGPGV